MPAELFPYQETGAGRLAERTKLILGDEPGLGKTRTALRAAQLVGAESIGVLCPAIVRDHWQREALALGLTVAPRVESYQRYVMNAEVRASWLLAPPQVLILDEFHMLKHRDSQRTQHVLGTGTGLAHQATRAVWPLSGTPMPRNPAELFPILYSLWPKRLAEKGITSFTDWLNRFCKWKPDNYGGIKVYGLREAGLPELRALLSAVMLRRRTVDVMPDLPVLRWNVLTLTADDLSRLPDLDPAIAAALEAGELPPMSSQLALYRHAVGDLKAGAIAQIVREELLSDLTAKRVIFAYHHSVLNRLQALLAEFGVCRIDGETTQSQRASRLSNFWKPANRVFLGQLQACATGMDGLQFAAHEALLAEPDWATDINVQAGHRLARVGQAFPVQVRMVALANSLDEALVRNHWREIRMTNQVLA